jgi:hypothetical protein
MLKVCKMIFSVCRWSVLKWLYCSMSLAFHVVISGGQVVHPSLNGGRPCGALMEHKVCSQSCEAFRWVADGWSECQLIAADRNRGCGTGDQYRQVR